MDSIDLASFLEENSDEEYQVQPMATTSTALLPSRSKIEDLTVLDEELTEILDTNNFAESFINESKNQERNSHVSVLAKYAVLANNATIDPFSFYFFTQRFGMESNQTKGNTKVYMAMLAKNGFSRYVVNNNERTNKIMLDQILMQRSFKSLYKYEEEYLKLMNEVALIKTKPIGENIIDNLKVLIYDYEIMPTVPLWRFVNDSNLEVYRLNEEIQDSLKINIKESSMNIHQNPVQHIFVGDKHNEPLILIESVPHEDKYIYKIKTKSAEGYYQRSSNFQKWKSVTYSEFLNSILPSETSPQETFIHKDDKIHIFHCVNYDKMVELLYKNGVFAMYYPVPTAGGLPLHAFAIPDIQNKGKIIKGYLSGIIKNLENRIAANKPNVAEYINNTSDGNITNWYKGYNLNGTRFCLHYLKKLGITKDRYEKCFTKYPLTNEHTIEIFKINEFKMAIKFKNGVRYTNQKGRSLPTINLSFPDHQDEETLPSRINWRRENYGNGKCTPRNCNCFFADKHMLQQIDLTVTKTKMPIKLESNLGMIHKFYNDQLEMYADQTDDHIVRSRLLNLTFESYYTFSNILCKKCGERVNTQQCENKCGEIIAKQLKEYNEKLKDYTRIFDEIKNDSVGTVVKACHFCPIIIVGTTEKKMSVNFFTKYLPQEIIDDEQRFKQFTGSDVYNTEMPTWYMGDHIQVNINELRECLRKEQNSTFLPLVLTLINTPNLRIVIDDIIFNEFFAIIASALPEYYSDINETKVIGLLQNANMLRTLKDSMGITITKSSDYFPSLIYFQDNNLKYPSSVTSLLSYKKSNPDYPCYQCERFGAFNRKHNTTLATNILPADNAQYDNREHPFENSEPMDDLNQFAQSFTAASMKMNDGKTNTIFGPSLNEELNDYVGILGDSSDELITIYDDENWDT